MDIKKIGLTREDLGAIVEAMAKFPDAMGAHLIHEEDDGKYTLGLGVMATINGMTGHFIVPLAMGKV
jgi:hypothetical protein